MNLVPNFTKENWDILFNLICPDLYVHLWNRISYVLNNSDQWLCAIKSILQVIWLNHCFKLYAIPKGGSYWRLCFWRFYSDVWLALHTWKAYILKCSSHKSCTYFTSSFLNNIHLVNESQILSTETSRGNVLWTNHLLFWLIILIMIEIYHECFYAKIILTNLGTLYSYGRHASMTSLWHKFISWFTNFIEWCPALRWERCRKIS